MGDAAGKEAAATLSRKFKPAAMIFIEKVGPNIKGIYHSIMGTPRTPDMIASAYHLADYAKANGIPTVGVGDGGNEIGCGVIKEAVREIQPFGEDCGCPCHGGVGTVTECDVLVYAAVSNWEPMASRRRWRVTWGTAKCFMTRQRSCASCTPASPAEQWTGPIPVSFPTSTAHRTKSRRA